MDRYRMEIVDRHMVAHLDAGLALIDTGAPCCIGRGAEFHLLGKRHRPKSDHAHLLELAGEKLQRELEWFLGNDVLGTGYVVLDWAGEVFEMTSEPPMLDVTAMPMRIRGVPIIDVEVNGNVQPVYLDTGAKLSYANAAAVEGLAPIRTEWDFSPFFGDFETSVYRCTIHAGGRRIEAELGVLPPELRRWLPEDTGGWVLGSDFFRNRRVVLDYRDGRLLDGPSA